MNFYNELADAIKLGDGHLHFDQPGGWLNGFTWKVVARKVTVYGNWEPEGAILAAMLRLGEGKDNIYASKDYHQPLVVRIVVGNVVADRVAYGARDEYDIEEYFWPEDVVDRCRHAHGEPVPYATLTAKGAENVYRLGRAAIGITGEEYALNNDPQGKQVLAVGVNERFDDYDPGELPYESKRR